MSLKVQELRKTFLQGGKEISVLQEISFQLESGEVAAILGQSGSGKSTLLSLLAGLETSDRGRIEINGTVMTELTQDARTLFRGRHIGIVFQSYHLVPHLTAFENVLLPLEINKITSSGLGCDPEEHVGNWLGLVGLADRMNHFPAQLSGGEAQRVAIARALVHNPTLVLADEPSGHLDQTTGASVMATFFGVVRRNRATTILVTHDPELAGRCDRVFRLNGGVLRT